MLYIPVKRGPAPDENGKENGPTPPDPHSAATFLDPGWVTQVAKTPEIDLRAHQIALTYAKAASHLDDLLFGRRSVGCRLAANESAASCNANWFHFAAWSTTTITQNIANQRPPQRIDRLPLQGLRRRLTPAVIHVRASSGQRVSRALSWGQRLIFVASCLMLRHLDWWMKENPHADASAFSLGAHPSGSGVSRQQILALGTWDKQPWIGDKRHLDALERALRFYIRAQRAVVAHEPAIAARYILGANVMLAAVDQDMINPAIGTVVNHVPQRVAERMDAATAGWVERLQGTPRQITSLNLPLRHARARAVVDTAWSRLMTDQVFVMALPTETLRLGRDIPPRHPGQPYFPADLQELTAHGHGDLDAVATLVHCLDRTTGNGRGSAARDWRRWDERMNWASTLMRSRQQDETLFWSPYSRNDQRRIVHGELPLRSGDPSALDVQAPGDAGAFAAAAGFGGFDGK